MRREREENEKRKRTKGEDKEKRKKLMMLFCFNNFFLGIAFEPFDFNKLDENGEAVDD